MASVFTGIANRMSSLLGQGQGQGQGGGGTKRGPTETDDNTDENGDDDSGKEPDSASATTTEEGNPPEEQQGQSAKKLKLSPSESSSSSASVSGVAAAAVLKEELEAIQRNVASQIETLGQKVKDIEGKEKNLEEENKNLKDLLYTGTMEIKAEKSKNESLLEQNKKLLSVLEKSQLDMERNLKESAQLLEITRAVAKGELKKNKDPSSPSAPAQLTIQSTPAQLTVQSAPGLLAVQSDPMSGVQPPKENVGENICSASTSSGPASPNNVARMSRPNLNSSMIQLHPDVVRFFQDFEKEYEKIEHHLQGERGRKLIRDRGLSGVVTTINLAKRFRQELQETVAGRPALCEKGGKCHHGTQTEGKVRPSLTECGMGSASASTSTESSEAKTATNSNSDASKTTTVIYTAKHLPCPLCAKAATKSDGATETATSTTNEAATTTTTTPATTTPVPKTSPPDPSEEDDGSMAAHEKFEQGLSFAKLSGLQEQVQAVRENILFPLVNKEALLKCGIKPAKGLIFSGPMGSGKYLLAKTLCTEMCRALNEPVHFFCRKKNHVFPRYSDKAQKYLKKLFEDAAAKAPCVIYLDDLDTLCGYVEYLGSEDAIVKCLAGHMDTLKSNRVVVIGATTQFQKIDPLLRKRSRFEKIVMFPAPNAERRKAILTAESSKWTPPLSEELLEDLTKKTEGWSADDMKELCRQAYLLSLHKQFSTINVESGQTYKLDAGAIDSIQVLPEHWNSAFKAVEKSKAAAATKPKGCGSANVEENIAPEVIDENLGFDSIGGLDEQMQNVRENILFPMLNKAALLDWGVEPVKGIIFHGPPGTGKTLLAKALAAELSRRGDQPFSFFYRKGTDSFQKYVGWTESYLRTLFAKAVAKKPAILFFDEIDGLCATRKDGSSTNFYNGIVTTMLGLMDGVTRGEIFVIAATNRLDQLDPAMTRPGRFDKAIAFFPPKEDGRKEILGIHSAKWKRGRDEEILAEIAKQTEGYTGADLEQLCRQTFLSALRRQFPTIAKDDYKMVPSQFDDFSILRQDWYTALGVVKGSNNKAFGNSISSGKAIPPGVSRLIQGIEKEIVAKLQPFLKAQAPVHGDEKGGGIKSFLIWDTGALQSRVIENFIVPSLICCVELKDTTTFTFGDDKVECTLMKSLMGQVMSTKSAILYIPRMDLLITKLIRANSLDFFMEQVDLLRGENVLVLASAGCSISELPEDFRLIFKGMADSRSYKLRKFEIAECREFFSPILEEQYPQLLERAEVLGHAANFYDLLDLKSELSQACVSGKEKEYSDVQIAQILEGILDGFEANKLDHCGPRNHMYS